MFYNILYSRVLLLDLHRQSLDWQRHIELTRSVLLLLVEENVGNFLKMQGGKRFSRVAWAAIPTSSSFGFLRPSSKVWQFSPRFSCTMLNRTDRALTFIASEIWMFVKPRFF